MKFGIQIPSSIGWLRRTRPWEICLPPLAGKNIEIDIILPATNLGYFEYVNMLSESSFDDDSKWIGFKLNLMTNISFETYDYGKIFTFAILGLGFRISKYNFK